jgi:peptidoglycan/LPS O-acetylase OafA/YrhL
LYNSHLVLISRNKSPNLFLLISRLKTRALYKRFTSIFDTKDRVFGLDLMRFIAIILVVFGHVRWMTKGFPAPIRALLHGSGILGVELFFVLSGFLIGGILLKEFEKNNNSLDFSSIKNFWTRRWFRTLPNYYFILLIYILVYFANKPNGLWRYFFFLQNVWNTPAYFFEESWSLCIEEISYLLSPLVLALSAHVFKKDGKGNSKVFLWVSLFLIALVTALRVIYCNNFLEPDYHWNTAVREVAMIRLDAIYYGFVAVYFSRKYAEQWEGYKYPFFVAGTIGVLGLMAFQKKIVDLYPGIISNVVFFSALSVCIGFLLPLLASIKTSKWEILAKPITGISIISYSMYLVNGGLISFTFMIHSNEGANWSVPFAALMYVVFWVLCISSSWLIYVLFEKPMTDLRNRFH